MAKFKIFLGRKYRLSGRYYRAENWGKGACNLHRARWEHYRGPIPEGFDVHHKDGDGTNNKMSNLELVERGEHVRQHTLERIARGELKPPSAEALRLAAEWHASPEGRAWHVENGKRGWVNKVWHRVECQECGREYRSPYPSRSKFCHLNCKMVALRRRRGLLVGTRGGQRSQHRLAGKRKP
jgi:hypothetical protein